jgi:dihydrofolate synthase/folylpolyglutamate synthase
MAIVLMLKTPDLFVRAKMFVKEKTSFSHTSLTPDSQRFLDSLGFFGWQLGLERIEKLCEFFGQPQLKYPTVHIAGTNGKGSTAAMLAAIGQAAGLRTGLYTSPHLVDLNERIQINGAPVSFQEIDAVLKNCRPLIESIRATYFEALTVIAFQIFAQQKVEIAIIETGLGGRLDATNVVQPEVTVITTIGLEHQQYLGDTLAKIAREKAGIIKNGAPCVSGVRQKTARQPILQQCRMLRAPFYDVQEKVEIHDVENRAEALRFSAHLAEFDLDLQNVDCALRGYHQVNNAASALLAAALLREKNFPIDAETIRRGLQNVYWPARLQILQTQPAILLDAAHNAEGMRALIRNLREAFSYRRLFVVMGLLDDKTLLPILLPWRTLQPHFFFAAPPTPRGRPAEQVAMAAKQLGYEAEAFKTPGDAFMNARDQCGKDDLLCVTGSHYLIGALMQEGCLPRPYNQNY